MIPLHTTPYWQDLWYFIQGLWNSFWWLWLFAILCICNRQVVYTYRFIRALVRLNRKRMIGYNNEQRSRHLQRRTGPGREVV